MTTPTPLTPHAFPVDREPMSLVEEALDRTYLPRADYFDDGDSSANRALFRVTPQGVAVIDVSGVIDSRASWFWTGYDEVQALVSLAMQHAAVSAVVLSLDSPGGVAAGMVDAGRSLRAAADKAGKPLVAHAGPMACSAAYGLACAADRILVTEDGTVGSVGCIAVVTDRTAQNAQNGLARTVIASGTAKADGHPDQPQTSAALSRMRARVMQLAGMFQGWVAARRSLTPEAVVAMQGAAIYGADAVAKGLADSVGTLADAIATAAQLAADRTKETTMDANATKALATTEALRATLALTTDDEIHAAVATLKQRAEQGAEAVRELATVRAALATRDQADAQKARAEVFAKHEARGALTPAMKSNAAYMETLSTLTAAQLDANLSCLPSLVREPAQPKVAAVDPSGESNDPAAVSLTPEEKEWCAKFGMNEASALADKRAEIAKRAARAG